MTDTTASSRKTPRRKTVVSTVSIPIETSVISTSSPKSQPIINQFSDLFNTISSAKEEFERLQKEIAETKESWAKEQQQQEKDLKERSQQEEIERHQKRELYEYETKLAQRKAEDEFNQRKAQWERELQEHKDEIQNSMKELAELRKQVAGFETEKASAVKVACTTLEKALREQFETARKLREQEVKAEKDLLSLRIANLTNENARQTQEIESLKKTLDDATKQLKDIAVKVIESGSTTIKPAPAQEA